MSSTSGPVLDPDMVLHPASPALRKHRQVVHFGVWGQPGLQSERISYTQGKKSQFILQFCIFSFAISELAKFNRNTMIPKRKQERMFSGESFFRVSMTYMLLIVQESGQRLSIMKIGKDLFSRRPLKTNSIYLSSFPKSTHWKMLKSVCTHPSCCPWNQSLIHKAKVLLLSFTMTNTNQL